MSTIQTNSPIVQPEWTKPPYSMVSGQGIAVSNKYRKYVGKSGQTWLVADRPDCAGYIYVTNTPANKGGEGFGGAKLTMPLVEGGEFVLHGGWHTNSRALLEDTGVDVRDKHLTFVVLAMDRKGDTFIDILFIDSEPQVSSFDRHEQLEAEFREAMFYYSGSSGGSSSGPTKRYHELRKTNQLPSHLKG